MSVLVEYAHFNGDTAPTFLLKLGSVRVRVRDRVRVRVRVRFALLCCMRCVR